MWAGWTRSELDNEMHTACWRWMSGWCYTCSHRTCRNSGWEHDTQCCVHRHLRQKTANSYHLYSHITQQLLALHTVLWKKYKLTTTKPVHMRCVVYKTKQQIYFRFPYFLCHWFIFLFFISINQLRIIFY